MITWTRNKYEDLKFAIFILKSEAERREYEKGLSLGEQLINIRNVIKSMQEIERKLLIEIEDKNKQ